jgi:hypothetical protein
VAPYCYYDYSGCFQVVQQGGDVYVNARTNETFIYFSGSCGGFTGAMPFSLVGNEDLLTGQFGESTLTIAPIPGVPRSLLTLDVSAGASSLAEPRRVYVL